MQRPGILLFAAATLLCVPALAPAEQAGQAETSREETNRKVVQGLVDAYVAAYHAGDAKRVAAFFTPDAELVGAHGESIAGREAVEASYAAMFAKNPGAKLAIEIASVRPLPDGALVAELLPRVTPQPKGRLGQFRVTAVLIRSGAGWLLQCARETLETPASYDHLKDLAWMVGDWVDEGNAPDQVSLAASCSWTANKSFLIRTFTAIRNGAPMHGTEVIGWDPRTQSIRSWVFGSEGGFSEGTWKRDGKRWVIDSKGVLGDGSEVSATQVITQIDDNAFRIESGKRSRNGENQPDVGPVVIKRRVPAAAPPGATPPAAAPPAPTPPAAVPTSTPPAAAPAATPPAAAPPAPTPPAAAPPATAPTAPKKPKGPILPKSPAKQ